MSRGLTTAMATAVAAKEVRPALFVYLDLSSGPVRVWSGVGEYTMAENVYQGVGTLGAISPIEETKSASANGITLSLSGIPDSVLSIALNEKYRGRKVHVWLGLFNASNALIADPIKIFAGRIDTMAIDEQPDGGTSTITLSAESRLVDLNRARDRRLTDSDQRQMYPNDRGLEYVVSIQNQEWPWGRTTNTGAASTSSSSGVRGAIGSSIG